MQARKVGIVGAGAVGATAAFSLAMMGTCNEIVLYDIVEGVAKGKAIDIAQAAEYAPRPTDVSAAESLAEMQGCDIVVITAGVPRKEGMTREDLLMINAKIMKDVVEQIDKAAPEAIIICVSNPLDVMNYVIHRMTGWSRNRIVGMAGALDGARMAYQIYKTLGFGSGQIGKLVIGDHGQKMIPMPGHVQIEGVNVADLLTKEQLEGIIERTRNGGAEIVGHLGTSGYYAPGRAVAHMVEAILNDTKAVVSSSVMLEGEYGYSDVCVGVPAVLGRHGVENVIEMPLDEATKAKFAESVASIRAGIDVLEANGFFNA